MHAADIRSSAGHRRAPAALSKCSASWRRVQMPHCACAGRRACSVSAVARRLGRKVDACSLRCGIAVLALTTEGVVAFLQAQQDETILVVNEGEGDDLRHLREA